MLRELVRRLVPAPLRRAINRARGRKPAWELLPGGWQAARQDPAVKGWNVQAVSDAYRTTWAGYLARVQGTGPLGFWYEGGISAPTDIVAHNIHMSYAYAFARAAAGRQTVRLLDWGGATGQYYALTRALFPTVALAYTCKDMPLFAEAARANLPEARFTSDDAVLNERFDLVLASSSLHYTEDWRGLLTRLASASDGFVYITRIPVVERAPSFVFVQRPYAAGYATEYPGWCLNRSDLLAAAERAGLRLVREFVLGENPVIERAPEQNGYRGFLFAHQAA